MIANIHHAKTHLSKLIDRALAGEEVVIAKAGKPVVRLSPVGASEPKDYRGIAGALRGQIWMAPDWEDNSELIQLMEGSEIFPPVDNDRSKP